MKTNQTEKIGPEKEVTRENIKEFLLIIIKPLGNNEKIRGVIDDMLYRYGKVKSSRRLVSTKQQMSEHYLESQYDSDGKPQAHYPTIVSYMSNKMVDVMILESIQEPDKARSFSDRLRKDIIGNTKPLQANVGTIRRLAVEHDLPFIQSPELTEEEIIQGANRTCTDNLIHCSDSLKSALREISIWFKDQPETVKHYETLYKSLTEKT